jgi:hypothetical protein
MLQDHFFPEALLIYLDHRDNPFKAFFSQSVTLHMASWVVFPS